ncbi:hypothetical protein TNCV_4883121, partial [Trichonephila clavipes]
FVPPSGGRKGKLKREQLRKMESEKVTLSDSDRGEHCFENR